MKTSIHTLAELNAFQGIRITDAWIESDKTVEFDHKRPTALVVGSALEFDDIERGLANTRDLEKYCRTLGNVLAREGFHLVNGACPGLPDVTMESFNSSSRDTLSVGLSAYQTPSKHLSPKEFSSEGFPISADITVFCGTGFELLNVLNTLCADILIVVGGGVGTLLEAATAVEQELPVLCLAPSGGVSRELRDLLMKYVADFKSFDVRDCKNEVELEQQLAVFSNEFAHLERSTRLQGLMNDVRNSRASLINPVKFEVSADTRSITYSYKDSKVMLEDPVLMTDRSRISKVPHDGEQILAALERHPRAYIYDGVDVIASATARDSIWGPNIDTLLLLRALKEFTSLERPFEALEIGFGSALISFWLAQQNQCQMVHGIDVADAPLFSAEWNSARLNLQDKCKFSVARYLPEELGKFDLVACNPPYLPTPPNYGFLHPAFAGCELLNELLESYADILSENGVCMITASSTSFLDERFSENIRRLSQTGRVRRVERASVPLKVHTVLDDPEWLDFLARDNRLKYRANENYSWWHEINVFELSLK